MRRIGLAILILTLIASACDMVPQAPSPTSSLVLPTRTVTISSSPPPTPRPTPAVPPVDAPAWSRDTVLYEVFVRSFRDSDDDGVGDLPGLTAMLDYLNDGDPTTDTDLGVNAIWLMPVFASSSNYGYETTDYTQVNPDYGTNQDLVTLVEAAHQRGIRVILDYVAGHTSDRHPFFVDAHRNPASQYTPFYRWLDAKNIGYMSFASTSSKPSLNYDSPETVAYMLDVARYWMDLDGDGDYADGVDGFRCDYAKGPPHAFWKQLRTETKKLNPDFFLLAEVWDGNPMLLAEYYADEFDATFDFPFYFTLGGHETTVGDGVLAGAMSPLFIDVSLQGREKLYPPGAQSITFISNHDTNRVVSDVEGDVRRARLGVTLLLTLPGIPLVYYGEEIGMSGVKGDGHPYGDEYRREPLDWYAGETGPGMTTWFQPENRYNQPGDGVSVEEQRGVPGSLWEHYRSLIALRNQHPALHAGDRTSVPVDDEQVYAYLRTHGSERILVVVNLADQAAEVTLTLGDVTPCAVRDLLTGQDLPPATGSGYRLALEPLAGRVLSLTAK